MFASCLNQGWVEVIVGSMFSGKSEELIRRVVRAQYAKQPVVVFKHAFDINRYAKEAVASHDGRKIYAVPVSTILDMKKYLLKHPAKVVAVDEAQFFDGDIIDFVRDLANQGKRVILAGLDQDFRGRPFGPIPNLLSSAEMIDKLNAICAICGAPASRTQRLVDGQPVASDAPIVLAGGKECYEARCRKCHQVPGE